MILSQQFAGLQQVKPCTRVNQTSKAPTVEELKAYFGLYIVANDFFVTPSDHHLFLQDESKWLFHTSGFSNVFTLTCCGEIKFL